MRSEAKPKNGRDKRINARAGKYFVLKTDRWAFESPQELLDLIEKVRKAVR